MGNNICTDATPVSFEAILKGLSASGAGASRSSSLQANPLDTALASGRGGAGSSSVRDTFRSLTGETPLGVASAAGVNLSREHKELFQNYRHNLKVWSFSWDATSSVVAPKPEALSERWTMDEKKTYVVLHVERIAAASPSGGAAGRATMMGSSLGGIAAAAAATESPRPVPPLEHISWALEAQEVFPSRQGQLRDPISVDLGPLRWRAVQRKDEFRYNLLLFLVGGHQADSLCLSCATNCCLSLEAILLKDLFAAEKLFYNLTAIDSQATEQRGIEPVPLTEIGISRASSRPPVYEHLLPTLYTNNYLLRKFLSIPDDTVKVKRVQEQSTRIDALKSVSTLNLSASGQDRNSPSTATTGTTGSSNGSGVSPAGLGLRIPQTISSSRTHTGTAAGGAFLSPVPTDTSATASPVPKITSPLPLADREPTPLAVNKLSIPPGASPVGDSSSTGEVDPDALQLDREARLRRESPLCTEIFDFLYVGGETPAQNVALLLEKGITHVVNAAGIALDNFFPDLFSYTRLYLGDQAEEDMFSLFPLVNEAIETTRVKGGKTLVHCNQGVSRSCSFVLAYSMWKNGWTYEQAFNHVKARRTVCSPNAGFMVNLFNYEKFLRTKSGIGLWRYAPYSLDYKFPLTLQMLSLNFDGHSMNRPGIATTANPSTAVNSKANTNNDRLLVVDDTACYLVVDWTNGRHPQVAVIHSSNPEHCSSDLTQGAQEAARGLLKHGFYSESAVKESADNKDPSKKKIFRTMGLHESNISLASLSPNEATERFSDYLTLGEDLQYRELVAAIPCPSDQPYSDFKSALQTFFADRRAQSEGDEKRLEARDKKREARAAKARHQRNRSVSPEGPPLTGDSGGRTATTDNQTNASDDILEGEDEDDEEIYVDEESSYDVVLVLRFPELDEVIEVYDYEDLEAPEAYLVLYRATRQGSRPNSAWIWIGCECLAESDSALVSSYRQWMTDHASTLAIEDSALGCAYRVAKAYEEKQQRQCGPDEEIQPLVVLEGEEDDDFVSML